MKTLPGYVSRRGYGYKGKAAYNESQYRIYGADCGADCVCDALAIPSKSPSIAVLEAFMEAGLVPSGDSDL